MSIAGDTDIGKSRRDIFAKGIAGHINTAAKIRTAARIS